MNLCPKSKHQVNDLKINIKNPRKKQNKNREIEGQVTNDNKH